MRQSRKPTAFGPHLQRLCEEYGLIITLEEKAVDYDLVPVDIFAAGGPPREEVGRHRRRDGQRSARDMLHGKSLDRTLTHLLGNMSCRNWPTSVN